MVKNNLVYLLDSKIYINLTNLCTNDCKFCIRGLKDDVVGANMWLETENITAQDVIAQLKQHEDKICSGVTFCGYGEPTIKIDVLKEVAKYIKETYPNTLIRVNTNGHGCAIHKRNILDELKGIVDEFSISLNGESEALYNELSQPKIENAYEAMKLFAKNAAESGFKTTLSVVTGYKNYAIDVEECEKIATSIGANFRNREWLDNGY
ncbi:radical SAM protein [bacterium]|nr:radical SAM protein [bacterium]